jgi:hypothetical protein
MQPITHRRHYRRGSQTKHKQRQKKGGKVNNVPENVNDPERKKTNIPMQMAVNVADKLATPILKSMGVDFNESSDQTSTRFTDGLKRGVNILKNPEVKKAIEEGFLELVDDVKPGMEKLASNTVSLVANVGEDVAGPVIGIPRTISNAMNIIETGTDLTRKVLGNVSKMSNTIAQASSSTPSSSISNLQKQQQRSFDASQKSTGNLRLPAATSATAARRKTAAAAGGASSNKNQNKTRRSVFKRLHAYF